MGTRKADLAGAWYPGGASDCRKAIEEMSRECLPCPDKGKTAVGGIVPHAGWFYSGRIACNVIQCLAGKEKIDICIIFGRHLRQGSPNYIMTEGQWDTPLGELEIDTEIAGKLAGEFRFTVETATQYEQDNTIELQLPFIKYFSPHIRIVPMGLPPRMDSITIAGRVAEICRESGRKAIALGSTDLTHYGHNYGFLPKGSGNAAVDWVKNENDKRVVDLMVDMDAKGVIEEANKNYNACCSGAAGAAIEAARVLGAKRGEKISYFTSYDVRPDSSFVGYAGIIYYV
jgi:MEMO1 family protein